LEQANQVSRHVPVWCEFFAEEGGYPAYQPHNPQTSPQSAEADVSP
jgi:hypothetical protein